MTYAIACLLCSLGAVVGGADGYQPYPYQPPQQQYQYVPSQPPQFHTYDFGNGRRLNCQTIGSGSYAQTRCY
jgi:hypothetical protein